MSDSAGSDEPTSGERVWKTHARGAFLAFHVLAVLVLSLPSPAKLGDRARFDSKRTQGEIGMWARRLKKWGLVNSKNELNASLWKTAQRYVAIHGVLASPFASYSRETGATQGWGMFKSPQRHPVFLRIRSQNADGLWTIRYESRSDTFAYRRETFDHNRIRKLVGRMARRTALFRSFAGYFGKRALQDFTDAKQVEVTLLRFDSVGPERRKPHTFPNAKVVARQVFKRTVPRKPGP